MQVVLVKCPACGAPYGGKLTSRFMTCEYCETRFALDADELAALGINGSGSNARDDADEVVRATVRVQEDDGNNDPMPDFAQMACEEFFDEDDVDRDNFKSSRKVVNGLGVGGEDVYLIHDDTMFKSGKNGFAITGSGIYCREMGGREAVFTGWADFAKSGEPKLDGCYIRQGDKPVSYFTDDNDVLEHALIDLYQRLYEHARRVM